MSAVQISREIVDAVDFTPRRSRGLDALRGLAMLAMLADHWVLVLGGPELIRDTVGRLAMPLFFLVAGHLAHRLSWRHAQAAALGLFLPSLFWWIETPNVLLVWAVGCVLLAGCDRLRVPVWIVAGIGLTAYANRWSALPIGYEMWGLFGLMALGRLVTRQQLGDRLPWPRWLIVLGQWPLTFYVGHLVILYALGRVF